MKLIKRTPSEFKPEETRTRQEKRKKKKKKKEIGVFMASKEQTASLRGREKSQEVEEERYKEELK